MHIYHYSVYMWRTRPSFLSSCAVGWEKDDFVLGPHFCKSVPAHGHDFKTIGGSIVNVKAQIQAGLALASRYIVRVKEFIYRKWNIKTILKILSRAKKHVMIRIQLFFQMSKFSSLTWTVISSTGISWRMKNNTFQPELPHRYLKYSKHNYALYKRI